jgi:ubiquinone/menaquinone biosynthesis C-methylase UbiE
MQRDPEGTELAVLRRFADVQGKHVLEIGCGEGRLTWRYAGDAGCVNGTDAKPEALKVAQSKRPGELERKTWFTAASAIRLPFAHEKFDIALMSWAL